jgi:hypothetical protein
VYTSMETKVNIHSFAEVEEKYPITYEPYKGFTVHLPERDPQSRQVTRGRLWGRQASTHVTGVYQGGGFKGHEGTEAATGVWFTVLPGANIHVTGWECVWNAKLDQSRCP